MDENKLYDILGVHRYSTFNEINTEFIKLAKEYHPHKNPNNREKFHEICFAYEVLSDSGTRGVYDKFGFSMAEFIVNKARNRSSASEDFSSQSSGEGTSDMGSSRGKCEDTVHKLKVTLEDVYNGKVSKIHFNRTLICKSCEGNGGKPGSCNTCSSCKGFGSKVTFRELGPGMMQKLQSTCKDCNGEGKMFNLVDMCKTCIGKKVIVETKILEVQIDKGILEGHRIFFGGEGDQHPGLDPGDFVVHVSINPHSLFHTSNCDLIMNYTITLTEALCGFTIPLKHLDGRDLIIRQKPGNVTLPDSKKMVPNEGMPLFRNPMEKGNLFITFNVTFPEAHFTTQDKLIDLEKMLPFNTNKEMFDLTLETVEEVDLYDYDNQESATSRSEAYQPDESRSQCATH